MVILPGDLVFQKGEVWDSMIFEKFTHSPYFHVAGVVNETQVIEAMGFKKTGYQALDFYSGYADIYRYNILSDKQRQLIVNYAVSCVGTRYDYFLFFWEVAQLLLRKVLPYRKNNRYICSTLWADAYQAAGVKLCPDIKYPTPGDLANSKLLTKVGSL